MNLESKDLEKLARLARLAVPESDRQALLPALQSIVSWVGELARAPVDGVQPMAHPHELALRLRDDQPQSLPERSELLKNAPVVAEGLFIVPRVVE